MANTAANPGSCELRLRTDEPLRVLVIAACPFPCWRGTPARVLAQLRALSRLGIRAEVVAYHLHQFEPPSLVPVHRIPSVPTYRRMKAGPTLQKLGVLDPLLLVETLRVARELRPHLLHGHHVEGGLVALAAGRILGVPAIFDAHTSLRSELPSHRIPLPASVLRGIGARIDRFLVRRSQHVITVTEALRADFLSLCGEGLSPHSISAIPNPIEPLELPDGVLEENPASAEGAPTVVYAGGLASFQRIDLLQKAFEQVLVAVPSAKFLIATSDAPQDLEQLWPGATAHPAIEFFRTSDLASVFACLARSDVAVSPRTAPGGLPQKILNYMAAGLPVVASTGSGPAVRHAETGWVVPDDDPDAFSRALVGLLRNDELRRRLGQAARQHARNAYVHSAVDQRIVNVYEAVLGSERRAAAADSSAA